MSKTTNAAKQKSIVVIGAGIVGVSSAIWLQRDGHRVVLIDKAGVAEETSYGNGGVLASSAVLPINTPSRFRSTAVMILNPTSPLFLRWTYLPKMLPWALRYLAGANKPQAIRAAKALSNILFDSVEQHQDLARGTGAEKWLKASDYIYVYRNRKKFEEERFSWQVRQQLGFEWQEMTGAEFDRYDPIFKGADKFAIRLKNHGHITDPGNYVKALAAHFERQGGKIVIGEVRDIKMENGEVTAIITSNGSLACENVVLAAGVWSTGLAKKLGIEASMETERGYHIELINPSVKPRAPLMLVSGKFVVTPMEGRIRCAGIVEFGGLDAPPSRAPFALLKNQIHQAIPNLKYDRIEQWMGHRPTPSDSIPLIGPAINVKGAYTAFGHHHIGLTGGPKTGRMIADMVAGRKSNFDLLPFEPSRFSR